MAPLPVIANVYRVALSWNGGDAVNVMHIRRAGSTEADVMTALEGHVDDQDASLWNTVSSDFVVNAVDITKLDGVSGTQRFTPATPASWTGGRSGDRIPGYCTLVSLRTLKRGREHRGRLYLPAMPEGSQVTGFILDTNLPPMETAWRTFMLAMKDSGFPLVVASYKNASAEDVVNLHLNRKAAVQRRRQARATI